MGEIGIPRKEFLYILQFWEARRILRGYQRRHRNLWSSARWSTFYIMSSQIGSDGMKKAGLRSPSDLMPLPWDKDDSNLPTEEEMREMQEEMKMLNNPWKK